MIKRPSLQPVRPLEILLVEDNPHDVELVRNSLQQDSTPTNLYHVPNGLEAISYLRKEGDYSAAVDIELILLDLNMPVMDGRETMRHIAGDPSLSHLPVIVLSVLGEKDEVCKLYQQRCNSFIQKPTGLEEFNQVIHGLTRYWANVAKLPNRGQQ